MTGKSAMSKKILGVGIIITGLLVLAIALIMGLEFPKYIFRSTVDERCILGYDHPNYNTWVSNVSYISVLHSYCTKSYVCLYHV